MPVNYDASSSNDFIDMGFQATDEAWGGGGGKIEVLDEGTYEFRVINAAQDRNKEGKPRLVIEVEVVTEGAMQGKKQKCFFGLDPESEWHRRRLINLLQACDVPYERGFQRSALIDAHYIGDVTVSDRPWLNPKTQVTVQQKSSNINNERPLPAAAAPPPPPPSNNRRSQARQ